MDITQITPGKAYDCKFKVETMLDTFDRPAPNLSDTPIKGTGIYESTGSLMQRDTEQRLVKLQDSKSNKEFVVSFDDIWDVVEVN